MINHETELRLQAYLDGEVSSVEVGEISRLLDGDAEARALYEELKATKTLLIGNDVELKLPESREFYWSTIRREIERAEHVQSTNVSEAVASPWWMRFVAPACVLAAFGVFVAVSLKSPETSAPLLAFDGHEIDTPLEETSSFSFGSETAGMTVVWVDSHRN
jgi:anti-sigma factor RsiW